jgi:serine/threonine kinase PknH
MSDAPRSSRVGTRFGPYYLKRLLGRGGMGEVYEAEHTVKKWTVALKLMSSDISEDPEFRERMQREARITGQLAEPHVVPIHEYGEIDGQLYAEMRLIRGTDLRTLLERSGPLDPARAVAVVRQIASALDAAHAAGVIHRDVKPQNILVTDDDFAYLVDFGIAKDRHDVSMTTTGAAIGSWRYMAPERFGKAKITPRADIYALACVLHECLTGSPPYRADTLSELVSAHLMEPIPRPSVSRPEVPTDFDAVIGCGMAKNPEHRYESAGALALDAHEALSATGRLLASSIVDDSQARTVQDTAVTPSPRRTLTKRRLLLVGVALAVVVAVVVVVVYAWPFWPFRTPKPTIPTVAPDRLDSLLLGTGEINTVMGASEMQSGQAIRVVDTGGISLTDQDCLGALYPLQDKTYAGSGYVAVNDRVLSEPGNYQHWVDESAVAFASADQSHAFVRTSADKWKFCPGRTLTATTTAGHSYEWTFGKLTGDPPKIALLTTQAHAEGWGCQHVLSAVSNVVLDVNACGYSITNQAGRIADKIAVTVMQ